MRKIYRIPSARRVTAARVFGVFVALAIAGIVTRAHLDNDVASHALVTSAGAPPQAAPDSAAPTEYFPSRFELHAGAPQPPVETF